LAINGWQQQEVGNFEALSLFYKKRIVSVKGSKATKTFS